MDRTGGIWPGCEEVEFAVREEDPGAGFFSFVAVERMGGSSELPEPVLEFPVELLFAMLNPPPGLMAGLPGGPVVLEAFSAGG